MTFWASSPFGSLWSPLAQGLVGQPLVSPQHPSQKPGALQLVAAGPRVLTPLRSPPWEGVGFARVPLDLGIGSPVNGCVHSLKRLPPRLVAIALGIGSPVNG